MTQVLEERFSIEQDRMLGREWLDNEIGKLVERAGLGTKVIVVEPVTGPQRVPHVKVTVVYGMEESAEVPASVRYARAGVLRLLRQLIGN